MEEAKADFRGATAAQTVVVFSAEGRLVKRYPRGTDCRVLLDQAMYDEAGDERVVPATPLGRVARAIVLERSWEAPRRAIDAYAELVQELRCQARRVLQSCSSRPVTRW